jgi:excalibur calcium-binding domain-containing protein
MRMKSPLWFWRKDRSRFRRRRLFARRQSGRILQSVQIVLIALLGAIIYYQDQNSAQPQLPALGSFADIYPNCASLRAAGLAPARTGQHGYAPHLDRDGIACEPFEALNR